MFGNGNKHRAYSREEIVRLLSQLPYRIDSLLNECVGKEPSFIPDYYRFELKIVELLKPFFEFSDGMFHAGSYSNVFRLAVRMLAAKKLEYGRYLQKSELRPDEIDKTKLTDTFMRFKLLFRFFGYAEQEYPGNLIRIFDLQYQLDNEDDVNKRQEMLEEISNITKESSTTLYIKALSAFYEHDLKKALDLCEQAIDKFPGNTPVYKLKADILREIARKTIEEGLQQEPGDRALRLASEIETCLWNLREKYANALFDQEAVIKELETSIQEGIGKERIDLHPYKREITRSLLSTTVLKPKTMTLLCTGEFLLANLFEPLDYAPVAIEFCKAVENELLEHVFKPFRIWCQKNHIEIKLPAKESHDYVLYCFVYKCKKMTLGSIAMVLQFLGSKRELKKYKLFQELKMFVESFPEPAMLVGPNGIRSILTPEAVGNYRNSAAHLATFTVEKAKKAKSWCFKLLNLLSLGII